MPAARNSVVVVPGTVWKFGYGSNMSPDFLRTKKGLNPLAAERSIIHGWQLSFPRGYGLDLVEPAFATLRRDPAGLVHGVSILFSLADARKLDAQEGSYDVLVSQVSRYGPSAREIKVEVFVPRNELPTDHPECCCSVRYRDVLLNGATEMGLAVEWLAKLRRLPVYTPSDETLAARARLPPPSELPAMTVAELALHDGSRTDKPVYSSACGYIFEHREAFRAMWGRDVTFRNVLHMRGLNLEKNDDKGRSPFPKLSQLEPAALEYALQYRDRFMAKCVGGKPVAVLREFFGEQDEEALEGVFSGNTLSRKAALSRDITLI